MPTNSHGHVICIGNLRRVYSRANTPEGHIESHNIYLFPCQEVSGKMVIINIYAFI